MPDYTLRQLEYFVAVAEAGSVTRAAASVHLSQSAMSAALADLENALSVQLLVRHHARGISLTPAGRELLVESRRLLASAADLRAAAQGLGTSLSGTLSIGCFQVVAPYLLPELLAAAAEKLPKLYLPTTEVNLADLAEGVANGTFELGIGYDLVEDARLRRWPLFTLPPYVLVSGSHRFAKREHVDLAELAEETDGPAGSAAQSRLLPKRLHCSRNHPEHPLSVHDGRDLPRPGGTWVGLLRTQPAGSRLDGSGRARRVRRPDQR